jgi:predicted dehydrogenase
MKEEMDERKLGIALVGLGHYATKQLAPAFKETKYCQLKGIVTGTKRKISTWKRKHDIEDRNVYNYKNFDSIRDNDDIDIVYVVLPNAMHKEFVVRAAQAGKHVICEKPMAITVEECDEMIEACRKAGVKLSIGYRLQFEPHNREMMRIGQQKVFGEIMRMDAEDGLSKVEGWRLNKQLAGAGPLFDVGPYCVQGVRYTTGMEPVAVTAIEGPKTDHEKFKDVEQSLTFELEMPDGMKAYCKCSYSEDLNLLRAEAQRGWFELQPAYEYKGIKGKTSEGKMKFPKVVQQALQMDDFARAIIDNRQPTAPGEMGRQDVKILRAVLEAMETGQRVEINKDHSNDHAHLLSEEADIHDETTV